MDRISKLIADKKGYSNLLDELTTIQGSELNSLLLELFRTRTKKLTPAHLLKLFETNRFVSPSAVDTIAFKKFELRCLQLASERGFKPLTLSPLTTFGSCSSVGFVDQNNVMTALRGTEVVSDATNVFALLIASEFRKRRDTSLVKYCTTHRHVRTQGLSNPGFTPHFSIFCAVTGGIDTGDFSFEIEQMVDHINLHLSLFSNEFGHEKFLARVFLKKENEKFQHRLKNALKTLERKVDIRMEQQSNPGDYYKLVQFKFFVEHNKQEINLSDGGFVDWTQKLIPNKKHRLMISGVGTELIHKIKFNQL